MNCFSYPQYSEPTKVQRANYQAWLNYYQDICHIAKFRASRLAAAKTNKPFNK